MNIKFGFIVLLLVSSGCVGTDIGYASRVLIKRDANTDDHLWKNTVSIEPTSTASVLISSVDVALVESAFTAESDIDVLQRYLNSGNTLSLLILRDGELVFEWYGKGNNRQKPAAAFSISKTLVALLVSRAVSSGQIQSVENPITDYLPELVKSDTRFQQIRLRDLIDMRSGIAYSEKVSFPWVDKDAPAIYYASDLAKTVKRRSKIVEPPGSFVYNDYAPNLIGLALEKATGMALATGPLQSFWNDIGAEYPVIWTVDDHGFAWHESGLVITARDLLRIGKLMLDNGRVNEKQVAPHSFLQASLSAGSKEIATRFGSSEVGYRNGWWTAQNSDGSEDIFAMGRHGQIMLVSSSNNIVIVRLGEDGNQENNIAIAERLRRVADRLGR